MFRYQDYQFYAYFITEAEYAYRLRKNVIPLLVEDGYQPDGWLGVLQGTRLYYNFYSDAVMKSELPRLLAAIKGVAGNEIEGIKIILSNVGIDPLGRV